MFPNLTGGKDKNRHGDKKSGTGGRGYGRLKAPVVGAVRRKGNVVARIAGVINGISRIHQEFLNDGGLGILIGDGMLPHPGPEQILESYYSYALSASTHLTADYQFIVNSGYNEDRGPVNVFSGRIHWQF